MQNDKSSGNDGLIKEFYETFLRWIEGNLCRFGKRS